jgi:NitT/TauT family transport system permease protein
MIDLFMSGTLAVSVIVSLVRVISGWLLGGLVGAPLGFLMGRIPLIRSLTEPFIQFFRFIPPIAFVSLFIVWFGIGEISKVLLVFYGTVFIVVLNTIAGVSSIDQGLIRCAQSLGANHRQLLFHVVVPATVPYVITGLRIALGNSFMTIVAAEMLAAQSGLGYVIWSSRNFMLTDQIFVAILFLGLLGLSTDRLFGAVARRFFYRYQYK